MDSVASCGEVLRDHASGFVLAFARKIGISPMMFAKLRTIQFGVQLSCDKGFSVVEVESDSQEAIKLILRVWGDSSLFFSS